MRRGIVLAGAAVLAGVAPGIRAGLLPTEGTTEHLVRQVCSYQWIDGVCDHTRYPDPGYRTLTDPHPTEPLQQLVGAVHEHSGYSDGDPDMRPRDYFQAGRTGHNVADEGGDSGIILDFMWSSDHSDNVALPITTAAVCLTPERILDCAHLDDPDHYRKWENTLAQAREQTTADFTPVRGFEWTNDYFNHMNVYFSTNVVNVKIDGSYLSMNFFWNWLREPVSRGGGADALVAFNHPGGDPHLSPFDAGLPHTKILAQFPGGSNWNDLAYVPDVDERVAGIEVNGGDDLEWYVKALTNGWHVGPLANEDEHDREWSTSHDGKTLVFARGRTAQDHYYAFQRHRTMAIRDALVSGAPGTKAVVPAMSYSSGSTPLGSTVSGSGPHPLHFTAAGLPEGVQVALMSDTGTIPLGVVGANGAFDYTHDVAPPASGEDWYFVVVRTDDDFLAVTAPIWVRR